MTGYRTARKIAVISATLLALLFLCISIRLWNHASVMYLVGFLSLIIPIIKEVVSLKGTKPVVTTTITQRKMTQDGSVTYTANISHSPTNTNYTATSGSLVPKRLRDAVLKYEGPTEPVGVEDWEALH